MASGSYRGLARCIIQCPADSTTADVGAVLVTECICNAGFTGVIEDPDGNCNPCEVATYKETVGPGDCLDCPMQSTTENTASTAVGQCLCNPGFTGTVDNPFSECLECEEDTWKSTLGTNECAACPDCERVPSCSSSEGETGGTEPGVCVCNQEEGWEGIIASPADVCRKLDAKGLNTDTIVMLSVAGSAGVLLAFGGIFFAKSSMCRRTNIQIPGSGTMSDPLWPGKSTDTYSSSSTHPYRVGA